MTKIITVHVKVTPTMMETVIMTETALIIIYFSTSKFLGLISAAHSSPGYQGFVVIVTHQVRTS